MYHVFFCQCTSRTIVQKTGKIFHTDINIPSYIIQIFHYFIIFHRNHMRIATKIFHCIHFLNTFFYEAVKIFLHRLLIRIFRANTAQFSGIRRNCNNFDRRIKGFSLLCTSGFIHLSERALSDLLYDLPFRPCRNRKLFVHLSSPPLLS